MRLTHRGGGALAIVAATGATRPIPGVRLAAWFPGSGTYSGWYATWGAATLYRAPSPPALYLVVTSVSDTDGGVRDEPRGVHVSRDGGASWRPTDDPVPADATEVGSFAMQASDG